MGKQTDDLIKLSVVSSREPILGYELLTECLYSRFLDLTIEIDNSFFIWF